MYENADMGIVEEILGLERLVVRGHDDRRMRWQWGVWIGVVARQEGVVHE